MSKSLERPQLTMPVSEQRDHIQGPPTATVTLVEYGDFQCPHCARAHLMLKELQDHQGDDLRLVYRHFPLSQIHPLAQPAAEASEAAAAQGRFWEMHDVIFEDQEVLSEEALVTFAKALGLQLDRFIRELAEGVQAPRVREDFLSGVRSGVNGTPTCFNNGRRHDGGLDPHALIAAIQGL